MCVRVRALEHLWVWVWVCVCVYICVGRGGGAGGRVVRQTTCENLRVDEMGSRGEETACPCAWWCIRVCGCAPGSEHARAANAGALRPRAQADTRIHNAHRPPTNTHTGGC